MNRDEQFLQKAKKIGGYDRTQVLDYIQKIRDESESKLSDERKQLIEARELIAHLESKLSDISSVNAQLNDRLYSEQRHVGELNLTINKLNIEISGQRVELNERERVNMDMKNQYSEIISENKRLKDTSKRYDAMKCRIGGLMVDAKANSERLIGNANRQAAEIIQDAKRQAEELVNQAHRYVGSVNSDILTLRNQLAISRKFAAELSENIINSINNVELLVNSMDYSVNCDEEFDTDLEMLSHIIAESHNRENNLEQEYDEDEE